MYDELELLALRKTMCTITFSGSQDEITTINCVLVDLFSENKAEYLRTNEGFILRLDKIIDVNGIVFRKP